MLILFITFGVLLVVALIFAIGAIIIYGHNKNKSDDEPLIFIGFWKAGLLVFGVLALLFGAICASFGLFSCFTNCQVSVQQWPSFLLFLVPALLYLVYLIWFWIYWGINKSENMHFDSQHPENDHIFWGLFNYKKGLAGQSFADLGPSMSVLVGIGVTSFFGDAKGSFWWLAQITAMVGVISVAAWVQRLIIEGPDKKRLPEKTAMLHLNSIAATLTVITLLVPTNSTLDKTKAAIYIMSGTEIVADYSWMKTGIFCVWTGIFFFWFLSTIFSLWKANGLPSWKLDSPNQFRTMPAFYPYFLPMLFYTLIAFGLTVLLLIQFGFYPYKDYIPDSGWSDFVRIGLGLVSAILVVVRQAIRGLLIVSEWIEARLIDKYCYQDLEKSILLFMGGVAIFGMILFNGGETRNALSNNANPGWLVVYVVNLVLMGVGAFLGVVGDAARVIEKSEGAPLSVEAQATENEKLAQGKVAELAKMELRAIKAEANARAAKKRIDELQLRAVAATGNQPELNPALIDQVQNDYSSAHTE